jgi:hypothetical protein
MESTNVEFDFDEFFFPRSTDEKLEKRDENKMSREKYNNDYKQEMRKKTRDREKRIKKEKQLAIKSMTDGKRFLKLEERDKYYIEKKVNNIKIDVDMLLYRKT